MVNEGVYKTSWAEEKRGDVARSVATTAQSLISYPGKS